MSKKSEDEEIKDPREALRNFVIEAKVYAFCSQFEPCNIDDADEIFTDDMLRKYFGAYPRTVGDPLTIYVDEHLSPIGFRMIHSRAIGEPVMPVKYRY